LSSVPLGFALLRRRGVAAWMAAETGSSEVEARPPLRVQAPATSGAGRTELVHVLAGMALLGLGRTGT
jgi:hypothetical protein